MRKIKEEVLRLLDEKPVADSPKEFKKMIAALPSEAMLESARSNGTPQYFLDAEALRERARFFIRKIRSKIPASEFFYAFKCNDLPAQIKILKEEGFQADVAGLFELKLALRLGFSRIVFSSPGKSRDELRLALANSDRVVLNIDNMEELRAVAGIAGRRRAAGGVAGRKTGGGAAQGNDGAKGRKSAANGRVRIGFRLNSEITPQSGRPWSKFGLELPQLAEAVKITEESGSLEWSGLHFHTSWNKTPVKYVENIKKIGSFLKRNFPESRLAGLDFFDVGGGFYPAGQAVLHKGEDKGVLLELIASRTGDRESVMQRAGFDPEDFYVTPVTSLEHYAKAISLSIKNYMPYLGKKASICFEPGRFIATSPTSILLRVIAVKDHCIITDGGINMLGDYKFSEYSFAPIVNLSRPSRKLSRKIIYGPLCDPHDLWGYSYFGEEPQTGDVLAVLDQGAYTFSTAWRFIKPLAPYIMYEDGGLSVAKAKERFSSRYSGCRL